MVRPITLSPEVDEWRRNNPLRIWVKKKPTKGKIRRLMEVTGVMCRQSIYGWMAGTVFPRPEKITAIRSLTKITAESWLKWFNARPKEKSWDAETHGSSPSES